MQFVAGGAIPVECPMLLGVFARSNSRPNVQTGPETCCILGHCLQEPPMSMSSSLQGLYRSLSIVMEHLAMHVLSDGT